MTFKSGRASAAIAAITLLATAAFAADVKGEIVTAIEHAEYSADANDIQNVHLHLYHALNCLVGPNGNGFTANQMNPCANAGNGIIPDTADAKKKAALEAAAARARAGLATTDIPTAKADAAFVAKTLKSMQ
ncbi:MAG TPA: hypothetical protein VHL34_17560 [Rhizomicrobium sp.]|jgi:hypothetical protein|nr:hypothetical protein [Rhizomicrobium sp.]